jgi:hypothetical protein
VVVVEMADGGRVVLAALAERVEHAEPVVERLAGRLHGDGVRHAALGVVGAGTSAARAGFRY